MSTPRLIPLSELHEDPANVRQHGTRNRAAVRASIQEFGQVETLVVQAGTGRVLGGNCRLAELRALGRDAAWCMEVDVQGVDATRLALALNRTAELAEWDAELLGRVLADLDEQDLGDLWTEEEALAYLQSEPEPPSEPAGRAATEGTFAILVTCDSERHQRELLERMADEGLDVRAWSL